MHSEGKTKEELDWTLAGSWTPLSLQFELESKERLNKNWMRVNYWGNLLKLGLFCLLLPLYSLIWQRQRSILLLLPYSWEHILSFFLSWPWTSTTRFHGFAPAPLQLGFTISFPAPLLLSFTQSPELAGWLGWKELAGRKTKRKMNETELNHFSLQTQGK